MSTDDEHRMECLIAWIRESPDHQLEPRNNFLFLMIVDDTGMRIEPYGD